ncbi:MAG TPA: hypothetical protein DCL80_12415 [Balneola sp.]|nr:hypothetical protein [Balneola sp.]
MLKNLLQIPQNSGCFTIFGGLIELVKKRRELECFLRNRELVEAFPRIELLYIQKNFHNDRSNRPKYHE